MSYDWIIESELKRRDIARAMVRLEPRHWYAADTSVFVHSHDPGGAFYLVTRIYGIESGVSRISGDYSIEGRMRGRLALGANSVQALTPSAGLLGLAAPWQYETPTWFEGTMDINVSRIFGGATYSLNMSIIVVLYEEEDCQC